MLQAIFGDKAGDVKDASLKAGPSLEKSHRQKLFTRAVKTGKQKLLSRCDKIEADFNRSAEDLKSRLVDKLFIWSMEKLQGLSYLNVDVIPKGTKFTLKQLQK